jgi:hypothetical protein
MILEVAPDLHLAQPVASQIPHNFDTGIGSPMYGFAPA